MPLVRRQRATFRSAEFGFFGVCVNTRVQTPRFCGAPPRAGVFVFPFWRARPLRTSWLTVGMNLLESLFSHNNGRRGAALPTGRGMVAKRERARKPRNPASGAKPEGFWPRFHGSRGCWIFLFTKASETDRAPLL